MKKKSTIWTYFKRALLIVVALIVVIFVSIYFLDVYKVSSNTQSFHNEYEDSYWEDLEDSGFISYDDILTSKNESNFNSDDYVFPFDDADDDVTKIQSARYKQELELIDKTLREEPGFVATAEYTDAYNKLAEEYKSYTYAKYNQDNFLNRLVLTNERFDVYMNMETTQFELVEKDPETGEVIESWLSNPETNIQDKPIMLNALQNSIFTITCVDGNKAATKTPITFNTYANATQSNPALNYIPSYYINIVEDEEGNVEKVLVYYDLKEKGVNYTWIPETITVARLKELFDRCNAMVAANKAENGADAVLKDSSGKIIDGLGYGAEINKPQYSAETRRFYQLVINQTYQQQDYPEIKKADGSLYTEDEIYEHLLNPDCTHKHDEDGEIVYDEDGNPVAGYHDCPICSSVSFKFKQYEYMTGEALQNCYRFFYEWCQYDAETDLIIDTGKEKQDSTGAKITAAIEYSLSENGLEVKVPGNSITTNTNKNGDYYMVTGMELLPYFTAVKANRREGYMVIPDGSGVVMEFDNNKTNYGSYSKRIYSSDLAFTSYTVTADTSDLLLPMYAYVYTDESKLNNPRAMVVEAKDGAAQVSINADTSNRGKNTYNHASLSITFRESQRIVIGTKSWNRTPNTQYTESGAFNDYTFSYMCLDTSKYECSYNGVAKFYRDLLVERSDGKLDVNADTTTKAILNMDVIGAYSYKTNFLGINYTGKDTLTTVDELGIIIDEILGLKNNDENVVEHINVYYKGWRNSGLVPTSFEKLKVSSLIGGKKALLDLINEYNENVKIYPFLEFTEFEDYQESFGRSHYTSRDVGGDFSTRYPYELNSNVFNKKASEIMVLSPAYYDAFSEELSRNYKKLLDINTLALSGLGSELAGDYRRKLTVFKSISVEEQIAAFNNLFEAGIDDLALETPYAYALEYASNAYNVPYQSTQYEILDYNIPFYQLVINGLFDYSGESINENVEKGLTEHTMRCIETGSNPAFTFTFEDSAKLLQTDYNYYYYTLYSRWLEDVKTICTELDSLGIYGCTLVKHEHLATDVYKVTYQNDVETIEIILNYQRIAWSNGDAENPITVPAKSYKVLDKVNG